MLNEVNVRSNRTRVNRSAAAWVCRQPACTSAESKLVPVCQQEVSKALGAWKSANVLTDHIALEAGFSKQAYQAQCATIDYAGREEKFVHVNKHSPWFLAAVGGPNCKRSSLPAVYVIEALQDKMFDTFDKQVVDDADRGRGEYGEHEEGVTEDLPGEDDPMLLLGACSPDHQPETPQKCKRRKIQTKRPTDLVRAIDMPKRPSCAGSECAEIKKVHMYVRPNSKALWIRLDCIDWLVSYAADEHHYQGISRSDSLTAVAAKDYEIEFDYNDKAWDCKINVGVDKGVTLRLCPTQLTKEMYEKTAASDPTTFDVYFCKTTVTIKRKACREYLRLWALAAVQGSRQDFEDEVVYQESPNKKRRIGADCETAVAASHPANGVEESQAASASAAAPYCQPASEDM